MRLAYNFLRLVHSFLDEGMVTCPHCGESYFTADTLHEIERIKLHRQSFAEKREVAIAEFV
ncbi:MAG: hypothetical protein B6D39_06500 [Anaerolineae bacterium UTCFX2]|nr:MAG: hypothetical protein B6D39_06500 [Anaerolineae bacterium UTCFX2]